jgi:AcrR family transcriptional regulator
LSEKDEIFWKILNAALNLDFRKGHLRWTMSELSRSSGITRSLIYYYFGKSRQGILLEAVKIIGEELLGLSPKRLELWEKSEIAESVLLSRKYIDNVPHLSSFYLMHRVRDSEIGDAMRRLETQYFKKMKKYFAADQEHQAKARFAVFFGLVFAPYLDEHAIRLSVKALKTFR